jgi:hypothetical protein
MKRIVNKLGHDLSNVIKIKILQDLEVIGKTKTFKRKSNSFRLTLSSIAYILLAVTALSENRRG